MMEDRQKPKRTGALKKAFAGVTAMALSSPAMAAGTGLSIGGLSFLAPVALGAMAAAVPILWYLRETMPPEPEKQFFPAMRFLMDSDEEDDETLKTPWWQKAMLCIPLIAGGLYGAETILDEDSAAVLSGSGPMVLLVDNGYASAKNWEKRQQINTLIDKAERNNTPVILLPSALPGDGGPMALKGPMSADEAREALDQLSPEPWPVDRQKAMAVLKEKVSDAGSVVWFSNNLADKHTDEFIEYAQSLGPLTIYRDSPEDLPYILRGPEFHDDKMDVRILRPDRNAGQTLSVTATDIEGYAVRKADVRFPSGALETTVSFDLSQDIASQIVKVSIDNENHAGSVLLIDNHWRNRPVGIPESAAAAGVASQLLRDRHYVQTALDSYAEIHGGNLSDLLEKDLAVLVVTDDVSIDESLESKLEEWVEKGGTLLRFAGPHLAAEENPDLVPVKLRTGERTVSGGALTDDKPAGLAPFPPDSPFYGIEQADDIQVRKEVLAEPGPDTEDRIWASLDDGTPLVTAKSQGKGQVVLVHTTASPAWSNLALSETFVDMLQAVVSQSRGLTEGDKEFSNEMPPLAVLNGFGHLTSPLGAAQPLTNEIAENGDVSEKNPPGFYGNETFRKAFNLSTGIRTFETYDAIPSDVTVQTYDTADKDPEYAKWLLLLAATFLIAEHLVCMRQKGILPSLKNNKAGKKPGADGNSEANLKPE